MPSEMERTANVKTFGARTMKDCITLQYATADLLRFSPVPSIIEGRLK
jgi:hypothetical protein